MNKVFIALGSNLGERENNILKAVEILSKKLQNLIHSAIYETAAEGMEKGHQFPFKNSVVYGETSMSSSELLHFLLKTEQNTGRIRGNNSNGHFSRLIDLDLLLFNEEIIQINDLTIPHPRMHQRLFVIKPMMDLAPNLVIPGLNKKVSDFYKELNIN